MNYINKIYKNLFLKDSNSNLGTIRITCAILGSLLNSYLIILLIGKILKYSIFENIVIVIILLPLIWSILAFLIVISNTKINAILKTIIPFIVLFVATYIIY